MPLKECNVSYFQELQEASGGLNLIDVREADEFKLISTPYAKNKPLSVLDVPLLIKELELDSNSDQALYVICRSGRRSAQAGQKFIDAGIENVYNLTGGMIKWQELGLPIRNISDEENA